MNAHYSLINKLITKPDKRDEVINILIKSGETFEDNAACLLYLVSEDVKDPNVIWVEDLWVSREAHAAALANPDLKPYFTKSLDLLEGKPEQIEIIPKGGKTLNKLKFK